jgi:hypothetical protein
MDLINRAYIDVMTTGDARAACSPSRSPPTTSPGLPVGERERRRAVRHDGQVRPAVLPELRQLRAGAEHGALHVLPPAAGPARTAQARQRPVRQRRADRLAGRGHRSTARAWATCTRATSRRCWPRWTPAGLGRDSLEIKRKVIQRPDGPGPVPLHQALPGHAAQPLLTLGVNGINEMVRNFSDDAHDITTTGATLRRAPARPRARAHGGVPGRPATSTTWRPRRPRAPPTASPRKTASAGPTSCRRARRAALLHQLLAAAGGLHRRPVRGAAAAGRTAAQIHRRHRAAPVHERTLSSGAACRELVKRALTRFRLPYITVTPTFSICPTHGYLAGEHEFCPKCDANGWQAPNEAPGKAA